MPKKQLLDLAKAFRKITEDYGMLLIINDSVDIAQEVLADGVHLGQNDESPITAKERAPDLLIGVSTHNLNEAIQAEREGANYINIGPIYSTQTKQLSMKALGIDTIKEIIPHIQIPFTVMGGIKANHLPRLIDAGVSRVAMVTEITQADNITERVKYLRSYFALKN